MQTTKHHTDRRLESGGRQPEPVRAPARALIDLRPPRVDDGAAMWRVARDTGVLDLNSSYHYLLLCKDFAETSIVALQDGRVVGFVTGYRPPGRPDVLFVWQVGVDEAARGQGIATRMLTTLIERVAVAGVRVLETTVTPSNAPSEALFTALARRLGTGCSRSVCFTEDQFPGSTHEAEALFRIGPFAAHNLSSPGV